MGVCVGGGRGEHCETCIADYKQAARRCNYVLFAIDYLK